MLVQCPHPRCARDWCEKQREAGESIGFVPTMGALHEGHLSLVRRAAAENDRCCASIFVNPLQFDDANDFSKYPRDHERDVALLKAAGCNMVFVGTLADFFPDVSDVAEIPLKTAGVFGTGLEGASRPGHLDGVATIVERLFHTVGNCRAYFGEKDFQQALVIRALAAELGFPAVVVCPTVREPGGLALSSRNALLSDRDRTKANAIFDALTAAKRAWHRGVRRANPLHETMRGILEAAGLEVDYAEVRDPDRWTDAAPHGELARAQALVAVRIGEVRLIDNLRLDSPALKEQTKGTTRQNSMDDRAIAESA